MAARRMLVVIWCRSYIHPRGQALTLSLKFFMHPDLDDFRKSELVTRFRKVVVDKPKESRKGTPLRGKLGYADKTESSEAYFVCLGYKG
jgi:hypothetical protein